MALANPSNTAKFAKVMKTEEKGSDVNLTVHLLNDAWMNAYDCAIVVTNDSDVVEAMRIVKVLKTKQIGLVTPRSRYPSRRLMIHANFSHRIGSVALRNYQLPSPIQVPRCETKPANMVKQAGGPKLKFEFYLAGAGQQGRNECTLFHFKILLPSFHASKYIFWTI